LSVLVIIVNFSVTTTQSRNQGGAGRAKTPCKFFRHPWKNVLGIV